MALPAAEDFTWARQRRATVRAAGGILDLVLPLRVGGSAPPVFCAPPVVGLSWCYLALFPHIAAEHPVYGLQSRGLRRPEPLPVTMSELAVDFADHLRMTQPTGPYHLFGWSLGGNVAFAIAEELESSGHEVGLLAILDATPTLPDTMSAADDQAWFLYNFVLGEFGYDPAVTPDDPHPEDRTLAVIRARPGLGLEEWPDRRIRALLRVIRNNVATARAHRPGRIRCPLLFFAATRSAPTTAEKLAAWRRHANGPIDVVELDCKHQHMLLPQPIARIGAELSARIGQPPNASLS
jgi:thioesterase domain-containing protein